MVTGARNEAHRGPQSGGAHQHQQHARHRRHHQQAGETELGDDARDDHHEGAGRPADLDARAAQADTRKPPTTAV